MPARWWRTLGAVFVLLVFVPPLVLLVSGSLTEPGQPPPPTPRLLPEPLSAAGYEHAWSLGSLGRATLNSVLVAAVAVPLSVLVAAWAGFALARSSRRLVTVVVTASLLALMAPATALLLPRFVIFRFLGLTDTLVPLIAPALLGASPLYVLVYYLAFRGLPADLYDTCRLCDLTPARTWWRFALPVVRPVTAALTALSFILTWSNFLDPLVYVYDRDLFTLPLALRSLSVLDPTNFPVFLAGAVVATLPPVIVFVLAQRWFLRSESPGRQLR
ncbi:carbohydrate ABC transporter permease [Actinoplanes aureus]|uniref:Carbohydrate ABC transporter permease n=1 Tax=Actinoplanes aureus TaxID=2792083 RepID=A0A931CM65_9ACTN|nr:carbohydrate ABC transporter permease [Actinoplanes aureus]MBG0568833.1 carbohydrate ABC transporter permease [Actinoplanes aureus]